jgi:hypothetical protein
MSWVAGHCLDALKGLTMNSPAGRGILTHGKGGQHPRSWTLTGSSNGASSLVASGSFSTIGWPRPHGLKPVEEGRHRDLPLHAVSPFGAPASRHLQSVCLSSVHSNGVQQKDMGQAQGSCLGMPIFRALPGLCMKIPPNPPFSKGGNLALEPGGLSWSAVIPETWDL